MPDINPQNIKELRALVEQQLQYTLCVSLNKATHGDIFNAVALAIRHFQQDHFLLSRSGNVKNVKRAFTICRWSFYWDSRCVITF
ncbi:glycogen phosphorylase [Klebsiella pneumoniae]|uniref:Glycogen phosphorylase n=1 Tax=Klebsiella pneumoniae TaxID=573 RepID=A0A377UX58_KLEPN|nr:glycogen phosphorylase [Klebsiella pneumoniae]